MKMAETEEDTANLDIHIFLDSNGPNGNASSTATCGWQDCAVSSRGNGGSFSSQE